MTRPTQDILAELKKVSDAATEGPWENENYRNTEWQASDGQRIKAQDWRSTGLLWSKNRGEYHPGTLVCGIACDKLHADSPKEEIEAFESNAQFIAQSRTALPRLIEALIVAAAELEYYKAQGCMHRYDGSDPVHDYGQKAHTALAEINRILNGEGK